jgi:hypothetical protein
MEVDVSVPQTPVTLIPGAEKRVPVDIRNRSSGPMSLRFGMAANRAGAWAYADPPIMELTPGDRAGIHVVFEPPADLAPAPTLQPFAVLAMDLDKGVVAGRGTGLLTVGAPERLAATLTRGTGNHRLVEYQLTMTNLADEDLSLVIEPRATPPGGRLLVTPAAVEVPAGRTVATQVRLRCPTPLVGPPVRYTVSVSCRDAAAAEDAPPLTVISDSGTVAPPLRPWVATVLVALLITAVLATAVGLGWQPRLPGRAP